MASKNENYRDRFRLCLCGYSGIFPASAKMDQSGNRDPAEPVQWQSLENMLTKLRVLDMDISVSRGDVFNLFIKKFQSPSLLEEYLRSSPYVMDQLKGADIDEMELHQAIVRLSEKMKAVDTNLGKKNETSLYTSWTLSFTAPQAEEKLSLC